MINLIEYRYFSAFLQSHEEYLKLLAGGWKPQGETFGGIILAKESKDANRTLQER